MWKFLLSCVNNHPGISGMPGLCFAGKWEVEKELFGNQLMFEEGPASQPWSALLGKLSPGCGFVIVWVQPGHSAHFWDFPTENASQVPALRSLLLRGIFLWALSGDEWFVCPLEGNCGISCGPWFPEICGEKSHLRWGLDKHINDKYSDCSVVDFLFLMQVWICVRALPASSWLFQVIHRKELPVWVLFRKLKFFWGFLCLLWSVSMSLWLGGGWTETPSLGHFPFSGVWWTVLSPGRSQTQTPCVKMLLVCFFGAVQAGKAAEVCTSPWHSAHPGLVLVPQGWFLLWNDIFVAVSGVLTPLLGGSSC